MDTFAVWYKKEPTFREDKELTTMNITARKFAHVATIKAESLDDVFIKMQAENFSPHGEARDWIRSKELDHTSMSVGDLIMDSDGRVYEVAGIGFREIFTDKEK